MRHQQLAVHEEDVRFYGTETPIKRVQQRTGMQVVIVGVGAVERSNQGGVRLARQDACTQCQPQGHREPP
jgi:hypothetical protein